MPSRNFTQKQHYALWASAALFFSIILVILLLVQFYYQRTHDPRIVQEQQYKKLWKWSPNSRYENKKYGFSLQLPQGWLTSLYGDDGATFAPSAHLPKNANTGGQISVYVDTALNVSDQELSQDTLQEILSQTNSCFVGFAQFEKISTENTNGYTTQWSTDPACQQQDQLYAYFYLPKSVVVLVFKLNDRTYENEYHTMLRSLHVR